MNQYRSTAKELKREVTTLTNNSMVPMLVSAFPTYMAILNNQRQIVYSNEKVWQAKGFKNLDAVMGLRPGENLSCVNAKSGFDGCGTSEACQYCGANTALVHAIETGKKQVEECIITTEVGGRIDALNFRITVTPIVVEKINFYVFAAEDISSTKRRKNLERIFFHDLINQVSTLQMSLNVVQQEKGTQLAQMLEGELPHIITSIVDNILEQRNILSAENGELELHISAIDTNDLISGLCLSMATLNSQVKVGISSNSTFGTLTSDLSFVQRILINLIKNAIEASSEQQLVTIGVRHAKTLVTFWVNNPTVMSPEVKNRIFQRSFSTKHRDRGLGTYSAKILTKNYLNGKIWFTSKEGEGTTFTLELPNELTTPLEELP